MIKKSLFFILGLLLLVTLAFFLGPRIKYQKINPKIDNINVELEDLDAFLEKREANIENLKPENEARIVWADSIRKTPYAIVYLHGFSASCMESNPVHLNIAKRYGCNMFLARLAEHGISDKEVFKSLSPQDLMASAKEAIAIGKKIGEKVILMSCSTGSTLSVPLAAENDDMVDALIMLSPNFALADERAKMILGPWGKQIAKKINGSMYRKLGLPKVCHPYWTMEYRLEGIFVVQDLIRQCIKSSYFKKIKDPVFIGYYYKNEQEQDQVISTPSIKKYFNMIPSDHKVSKAFSDVGAHVIASECQSKDLKSVENALNNFIESSLNLVAIGK